MSLTSRQMKIILKQSSMTDGKDSKHFCSTCAKTSRRRRYSENGSWRPGYTAKMSWPNTGQTSTRSSSKKTSWRSNKSKLKNWSSMISCAWSGPNTLKLPYTTLPQYWRRSHWTSTKVTSKICQQLQSKTGRTTRSTRISWGMICNWRSSEPWSSSAW